MKTVIEKKETLKSTHKERIHYRSDLKPTKSKSGKGFAGSTTVWALMIFIMLSIVVSLRTYTSNLEVMSLLSQKEMIKVDERIDELKGEINNIHTESLMNASHENSQIADNCHFVSDLWEVGG